MINLITYLGVKTVRAEPQEKDGHEGYKVVYEDGYVSWSPKVVFEKAYRSINGLTFGQALEAMNEGNKVSRAGWNGKGMWIAKSGIGDGEGGGRINDAEDFWNPHARAFAVGNGGQAEVLPLVIMKTADNKILMGWLASQSDMFATDWGVVE